MTRREQAGPPPQPGRLALWGGLESTVNRVGDQYFSQMERSGHLEREGDLDLFASLGISALRYPVLWERVAPHGLQQADWNWTDQRLHALRRLALEPIAGLVHHGSGPRHTSLTDPRFAAQLAEFAAAVARRYPWLHYYTPVNEPLTTARFSGLYGVWYPHGRDDATFVRALLNQCRGVVLAMAAIRQVNPLAQLVQTDDLGKSYATSKLAGQAAFYNERRWLTWDLLCGMVTPRHAMWAYLTGHGASAAELDWFERHACPPDIVGVNYYVTSERWLDHRRARFGARHAGPGGYVDIEASRALAKPLPGIGALLDETWQRYKLPIAITETHIDSRREDQLRWLMEVWQAAEAARRRGIALHAVTVWALLGSYDWNSLVTESRGYYESGAFDMRSGTPRQTAVATLMRELACGRTPSNPVLAGQGWWRRPGRFFCAPVTRAVVPKLVVRAIAPRLVTAPARPLLVAGAGGALGRGFARICAVRDIAVQMLARSEMDIADPAQVDAAIARYQPWGIINAGGYREIHDAGRDVQRCERNNLHGPAVLAIACARHGLRLLTFSSAMVFDGTKRSAYLESDPVAPTTAYGKRQAEAEQRVRAIAPRTLLVRSGPILDPWHAHEVAPLIARLSGANHHGPGMLEHIMSPTYLPDLVHASLDLIVDAEEGIWHLSNNDVLSWRELRRRMQAPVCGHACVPGCSMCQGEVAPVAGPAPPMHALGSERGILLPPLADALRRYRDDVLAP